MRDTNHELKDAGLVASSAAGTVGGEAVIVDLGEGLMEGEMVIDVSAIEIASDNELYTISLQGSSEDDFADTYENLAAIELGAAEVLDGDQDSTTGRYILPFRNEKNGTKYRYARCYCACAGTIATGINYKAYLKA